MDLMELTPGVGPARGFRDPAIFIEMMETCIGVSLQHTTIRLQVLSRALALAIGRIREPHGWGCCVA